MLGLGIFKSVSFWMECSCMAPRTPAVIVITGLVFQPCCGWLGLVGRIWRVFVRWLDRGICHGSM
jgi:hypothetical protein